MAGRLVWLFPVGGRHRKERTVSQSDRIRRGLRFWMFGAGPIVGLISLVWFIVRVAPKPSRAAYPCQRVAMPLASGFVVWLTGIIGSVLFFRQAKHSLRQSRKAAACACLAVAAALAVVGLYAMPEYHAVADNPTPNSPIGAARGLNPGRVVWVHDPSATDWQGPGYGHWWESTHTSQTQVDQMMSRAIRGLTGAATDSAAWDTLIRHFNQTHGKGNVSYQTGEKVAIKVNFVGCIDSSGWGGVDPNTYELTSKMDYMNTSPQVMLALLRHLVNVVGVNQADISIGDPVCLFPNQYYDPLHNEFPNVQYLDHQGKFNRTLPVASTVNFYFSARPSGVTQDKVLAPYAQAAYFINLANLKSHEAAGITACGKNYYGFLRLPPETGYYSLHDSLPQYVPGMGHYRCIVDLMGHAHTGGKALLYMIDGLYGGRHMSEDYPRRWDSSPFNGDWTSSLFVSQDPVAIDSVAFDFLWEEWTDYPRMSGAEDYLHEAALADNPPSGTFYDPDHATNTTRLASLGVHEHWNNATSKQYSRNLGTGSGIELIQYGPAVMATLNVKQAGRITIDGSPSDWNLAEFTTVARGGLNETGDYALIGYSGATCYSAGHWTDGQYPPTDRADHTARVWSRHDSTYQYFLVRLDDSDIRTPNGVSSNWANDCVEFFIDPSHDGGASTMSSSTSDIQLVIDAANQKNVYMTTSGYASQILAGVTSDVTAGSYEGYNGWWLEVRITKTALDPDLPASGTFGVDFNFRDNDNNNDVAQTTVHCWNDPTVSGAFPSKIPDNWADAVNGNPPVTSMTLNVKRATSVRIDGKPEDWNLAEFTAVARGGQTEMGDYALTGYSGATCYSGGHWTGGQYPPTDRADHTARVWSRHDDVYQYFLVRVDDSGIRTPNGVSSNWANDCVEFYIDPAHDGGASAMSNSTSDIQLVIDAANQKNVYMTTSGYATQVLAGVTSAVTTGSHEGYNGWWLEVRIQKTALDPDMPVSGTFGVDFNFRDNDGVAGGSPDGGIAAQTTVYCWADPTVSGGFPSKIPDNWADAVNGDPAVPNLILDVKPLAGAVTVDGSASDWNLSEFTTFIRGGDSGSGDKAFVGYDAATGLIYRGGFDTTVVLPTSAADHSATIYSRHDATYQYFLVRVEDSDMRWPNGVDMNWANDCVEFYIDPAHDGGASAMSNSTSDIQLVVDAANQKNVYMCTSAYRTQVLAGVTSAVVRDGTGWTAEVRIQKSALDPDMPATGTFGVDFNFRDNDNNNDTAQTTIYAWRDPFHSGTTAMVPTKIPNNWGDAVDPGCTPPDPPTSPTANPTAICAGGSSTLSATVGGGETVDWYTESCGGTLVGSGTSLAVSPTTTTTYYPLARNTTTGCVSTSCGTAVTVTVNALPSAPGGAAANPTAICAGGSSTLSATVGGGETVDWYTGSCGGTLAGSGTSLTVSPATTTIYYPRARNTTTGCVSASCAAAVTVTVNTLPSAPGSPAATPPSICPGESSTLTATAGVGETVDWYAGSCGETLVGSGTSLPVSPAETTAYYARARNTTTGCISASCAAAVTVTVKALPTAPDASNNGPICAGSTLNLMAGTVANATYAWTGPNGFTSSAQNPSIENATTAASGDYSVTVTVEGCTSAPGTTAATVNAIPEAPTATNDGPVSQGQTLHLYASTVVGATYSWTGPNGFVSSDQNPVIESAMPEASGTYYVTATVSGCTCATPGSTEVTVYGIPLAPTAGSNSPVCAGDTLSLTATPQEPGVYTWSWTGPNGFTSSDQNPSIENATTAASGTYQVTATAHGLTSPAGGVTVVVNPIPDPPTASSNGPICEGATLNLMAGNVPNATYAWTGPNGFASSSQNPSIENATTAASGEYSVAVTVDGCTSAATATTVTVNAIPAAPTDIQADPPAICLGQSSTLSASVDTGETVDWYTGSCGETLAGSGMSLVVSNLTDSITYYPRARKTTTDCVSTSCGPAVTVLVNPPPDDDGDGIGDLCDRCGETVPGASVDTDGCPPVIPGDFNRDGDVDGDDLGVFESCASGPAVPHSGLPHCQSIDSDRDNDVDQSDFAAFQRCISGKDHPADPACAD